MAMESLLRSTCVQGRVSRGLSRLRFLLQRSSESPGEKGVTNHESRLRLHPDGLPPDVLWTEFSIGASGSVEFV